MMSLIQRGMGRYCPRHKSRRSRLGVLWADGRGCWFPCNRQCLKAWEKEQGRKALVVLVADIPLLT